MNKANRSITRLGITQSTLNNSNPYPPCHRTIEKQVIIGFPIRFAQATSADHNNVSFSQIITVNIFSNATGFPSTFPQKCAIIPQV